MMLAWTYKCTPMQQLPVKRDPNCRAVLEEGLRACAEIDIEARVVASGGN